MLPDAACLSSCCLFLIGHSGCLLAQWNGTACSPAHFFRYGTAHILTLGLLRDFWVQWLPTPAQRAKRGEAAARMCMPPHVRQELEARSKRLQQHSTSALSRPYRDIVQYAYTFTTTARIVFLTCRHLALACHHCSPSCNGMHHVISAKIVPVSGQFDCGSVTAYLAFS